MSAAEPDIARRIENFDVFARQAGVAAFFSELSTNKT